MNSIIIIVIILTFSLLFSGLETAFISSNQPRTGQDKKMGISGYRMITTFINHPGQYIMTILIGKNICLTTFSVLMSQYLQSTVLVPVIDSVMVNLFLQIMISATLFLLAAGIIPKIVFIASPDFFLRNLSLPAMIFYILFYPFTKFTLALSGLFADLFPATKGEEKARGNEEFGKIYRHNLENIVSHPDEKGEIDQDNFRIFQNALDLSNIRLWECMVPRTEIIAIDINSTIEELKAKFIENQLSRILIYQDTIDNMAGYFDLKDLFKNLPDIKSSLKQLVIVPETMSASKLLRQFVDEKKSIALVVDEFGGTSGMVTIEDILEEIVGDIEDEHDINKLTEKVINEKEYLLSGRLEIDYLNEKYNLNLPESDDYKTLAGMIFFYNGSIPGKNDTIRIRNLGFRILRVTSTRLELVSLRIE